MKYGYARVSSRAQDYTAQVEELKAAGCEKIYSEEQSGNGRTEEGIERAKAKGTKFGRPTALDDGEKRRIACPCGSGKNTRNAADSIKRRHCGAHRRVTEHRQRACYQFATHVTEGRRGLGGSVKAEHPHVPSLTGELVTLPACLGGALVPSELRRLR
jgi:hypothetical protein